MNVDSSALSNRSKDGSFGGGRPWSRSLRIVWGWLLVALVGCGLWAGGARAADPAFMPVAEIQAGMKGIGKTVFHGDSISTFGVEIVAVLRNSRPKGDLILFRAEGPFLDHSGIIAGMSGSPVYIGGRLIGAVAFAYPYCKDPIGGITPIAEMLDLLSLPQETFPEATSVDGTNPGHAQGSAGARERGGFSGGIPSGVGTASSDEGSAAEGGTSEEFAQAWSRFLGMRGASRGGSAADGANAAFAGSGARAGGSAEASGAGGAAEDAPPWNGSAQLGQGTTALQALAVPLSMSGWDPSMIPSMERSLHNLGFVAAPGGGDSDEEAGRAMSGALEPGSAVGVSLVRGDANLAAIGTVTHVAGDRILAFGHPMIQSGPVALPMSRAWIHTVMPNLEVSYKVGSSTGLIGGLWEDRRPGVAGVLGQVPEMLPIRLTLESGTGPSKAFRYTVVRHPGLTATFLPWTVTNSYLSAGWAQGDATARSEATVYFNGSQSVSRVERFSTDSPGTTFGSEIALPASVLMLNPFEAVHIDSMTVDLRFERKNSEAEITGISCYPQRVSVGDTLNIRVEFEPHRAAKEVREVKIPVPGGWAGKRLVVAASGATEAMESDRDRAPEKYTPRSLSELQGLIASLPNEGDLIVRVLSREPGNLIEGRELPSLPASFASAGVASGGRAVVRSTLSSLLDEEKSETPWILSGRESVEVEVKR